MVTAVTVLPNIQIEEISISSPSLDQVTSHSLREEVRAQLYEQTYEFLQYLNMPCPEGATTLNLALGSRLDAALDLAQKGKPPKFNFSELLAEMNHLLYVGAAGSRVPGTRNAHRGPWWNVDTEPRTELECVLRACIARVDLNTEKVAIGRVAALASLPINTMRIYARRHKLKAAHLPRGHVSCMKTKAWLVGRGIEGLYEAA
jgi:hypothetical protein